MVQLVRHRQTKGPATDRFHLNHRATSRLYSSGPFSSNLLSCRSNTPLLGVLKSFDDRLGIFGSLRIRCPRCKFLQYFSSTRIIDLFKSAERSYLSKPIRPRNRCLKILKQLLHALSNLKGRDSLQTFAQRGNCHVASLPEFLGGVLANGEIVVIQLPEPLLDLFCKTFVYGRQLLPKEGHASLRGSNQCP